MGEESVEMDDTKSNFKGKSQYFESGAWKCGKNPTGAHHWIINGNMMKCKYCHEERSKTQQTEPRSRV
jgi:hypothetical protein